jgi:hypothetical protein
MLYVINVATGEILFNSKVWSNVEWYARTYQYVVRLRIVYGD